MKVMVAVEHLSNNHSLVIMQLGDKTSRTVHLPVNEVIVRPFMNMVIGLFYHRDLASRRKQIVESPISPSLFKNTIADAIGNINMESMRYGYACKVSSGSTLVSLLKANEAACLAFIAPTKTVKQVTDSELFNEFYGVNEDTGLLDALKETIVEYSTSEMVDAMIADL